MIIDENRITCCLVCDITADELDCVSKQIGIKYDEVTGEHRNVVHDKICGNNWGMVNNVKM